jgi:hypothetical protein
MDSPVVLLFGRCDFLDTEAHFGRWKARRRPRLSRVGSNAGSDALPTVKPLPRRLR